MQLKKFNNDFGKKDLQTSTSKHYDRHLRGKKSLLAICSDLLYLANEYITRDSVEVETKPEHLIMLWFSLTTLHRPPRPLRQTWVIIMDLIRREKQTFPIKFTTKSQFLSKKNFVKIKLRFTNCR